MNLGAWLIAFSGWLVIGCASSLKLSSTVVDKATGKPVQVQAVAKLVDKNDTVLDSAGTLLDGTFLIKAPPLNKAEEYRVVVTIPLLSEGVREVVHQDRKPPISPTIPLQVLSGLVGVVTDENDAPIVSAMVKLALPDAGPEDFVDETETGPGGEFSFASLEPGDYILRILHYLHYPGRGEHLVPGRLVAPGCRGWDSDGRGCVRSGSLGHGVGGAVGL